MDSNTSYVVVYSERLSSVLVESRFVMICGNDSFEQVYSLYEASPFSSLRDARTWVKNYPDADERKHFSIMFIQDFPCYE